MTDQTNTGTYFAANLAGSAGATLRAAREKSGLRLDEVALKTKIPLHVLEAIEHDDTAKLGQPVYVRGYLRKYAAALGVPESKVLTSFDARAMAPPKESTRLAEEQVEEPATGSRAILWVLVVIILAAAACAAVLYLRGWGPAAIHRKSAPHSAQHVAPPPAQNPAGPSSEPSSPPPADAAPVEQPPASSEQAPAQPEQPASQDQQPQAPQ
jgi:cytoskeleton protein RodZ